MFFLGMLEIRYHFLGGIGQGLHYPIYLISITTFKTYDGWTMNCRFYEIPDQLKEKIHWLDFFIVNY